MHVVTTSYVGAFVACSALLLGVTVIYAQHSLSSSLQHHKWQLVPLGSTVARQCHRRRRTRNGTLYVPQIVVTLYVSTYVHVCHCNRHRSPPKRHRGVAPPAVRRSALHTSDVVYWGTQHPPRANAWHYASRRSPIENASPVITTPIARPPAATTSIYPNCLRHITSVLVRHRPLSFRPTISNHVHGALASNHLL